MIQNLQLYFIDYLPLIVHAGVRGIVVFVLSLGIVYIIGRMFDLVHGYRAKNLIALVSMIIFSWWSIQIYDQDILVSPQEIYWRVLIYTALASIFYVLVGFSLFDRFNAWMDKKFVKAPKKGPSE